MDYKDKNAILEVIKDATSIGPGEYLTFVDTENEQLYIPLDVITRVEKGVAHDESDKEVDPEDLGYTITTTGVNGYDKIYKYVSEPLMVIVMGKQEPPELNDLSDGMTHFQD